MPPAHTIPCRFTPEREEAIIHDAAAIEELVRWQERQNGSLGRVANAQDELRADLNRSRIDQKDQLAALEGRLTKRIDDSQLATSNKFDGYNSRQQTLMGGMIASLFLLAANLALTFMRGG